MAALYLREFGRLPRWARLEALVLMHESDRSADPLLVVLDEASDVATIDAALAKETDSAWRAFATEEQAVEMKVTSHDKHVTGFARIGATYKVCETEFTLVDVRDGNLVFTVAPPKHQIGVRIQQLTVEDRKP